MFEDNNLPAWLFPGQIAVSRSLRPRFQLSPQMVEAAPVKEPPLEGLLKKGIASLYATWFQPSHQKLSVHPADT